MLPSPAVADASLCLSLLGVRGAAPVLLGMAVDDEVEVTVLDERFGDAALARGLRVGHLGVEAEALCRRAEDEGRRLVVFDNADVDRLRPFLPAAEPGPAAVTAVVDLAAAWHARVRGTAEAFRWPARPDLDRLLTVVGRRRTHRWDPRRTAPRLRHVQQQLLQRGAFDALTPTAKAKWTRLLQHCEADARGLRVLVCELTRRLTVTRQRSPE